MIDRLSQLHRTAVRMAHVGAVVAAMTLAAAPAFAAPAGDDAVADAAPAAPAVSAPSWVGEHWERLVGRWITDNSSYQNENETADAYGVEWRWGVGRGSLTGHLFAVEDGVESGAIWEFREFWHPGSATLVTEQFGADGVYGVGTQEREADGTLVMEQTFYYPGAGATARIGHRSTLIGNEHTTHSFQVGEDGTWTPRRSYVWLRQEGVGEEAGGEGDG